MLPLVTHASVSGVSSPLLLKVIDGHDSESYELGNCAVLVKSEADTKVVGAGAYLGHADVVRQVVGPRITGLADASVVSVGDVIRVAPGSSAVRVMYRRGGNGNVLFVTEQCNSKCLMCSQPPKDLDDSWRIDELLRLIPLIDPSEESLGITGGEPTLLGTRLADVLAYAGELLPSTALHVLSNGRRLSDRRLASELTSTGHSTLSWGIPLYSDVPETHDYVVQAKGAFVETLHGIYNLAERKARIEIRVVLHRLTIPRLRQLAHFIFHNAPFVEHVALMGTEPIGFAPGNRELLWQDPAEFSSALEDTVYFLANRGIPVSLYNLPLCVVPQSVWGYYRKSISDWKNSFLEPCTRCAGRKLCGGFFSSTKQQWVSDHIRPLQQEDLVNQIGEVLRCANG